MTEVNHTQRVYRIVDLSLRIKINEYVFTQRDEYISIRMCVWFSKFPLNTRHYYGEFLSTPLSPLLHLQHENKGAWYHA